MVDDRLDTLISGLGEVSLDACCAGAAGAEAPYARERLRDFLATRFPGIPTCVVHDSHLVLAAAGRDAGIALIAGTGTVAYARAVDGREARRGGWGWMIGDEGGGVWITREAARLVMTRSQAGEGIGALGEALLAACAADGPEQMIASLHERSEPMEWAALAATVFDTEGVDRGSSEIIHRAATELARLVLPLGELCPRGPLVLAGGLLLNQATLESELRALVPFECVRLQEPAVEGAIRLAEALLR